MLRRWTSLWQRDTASLSLSVLITCGGDSVLQLRVAFPILSSTDGFNKYGLMHRAFVVFMWGSPGSGGLTSPPDGLVF